ncbi:hypothetical protein DRJ17_05050 [Candidatus Woesearchaeota archaeon]|nr:MAG: hypothetical protein DRJ17_05050 [Candidatus Woesearchaeota archaeon]
MGHARLRANEAINRFPICAAWYYKTARYLGFDDETAKSLGLARATFFARAKQGKWGGNSRPGKASTFPPDSSNEPTLEIEVVNFAGLESHIDVKSGLAIFGGKLQTAEMFDKRVKNKFANISPEAWDRLMSEFEKIMESYKKEEINSHLAYRLYEDIRDYTREKRFYGIE